MNRDVVEYLCCPACKGDFVAKPETAEGSRVVSGTLTCKGCGRDFEIAYGLPNLVHPEPEKLPDMDRKFLDRYQRVAASYDRTIRLLMLLFGMWEPRARRRDLITPLELQQGQRVLEVSAGTGSNLLPMARQIGRTGKLFALDLSPGMLAVAREKLANKAIEAAFSLGNAGYLPYRDDSFDAVLHFGGINTFGEKKRALAEIVRVARPGAKIVIGDEGLAPGKENTRFGRWLLKKNTLYANKPPMELLPRGIAEVDLKWVWRGLFYVISFRKAHQAANGPA
ncbi:MAG: methyltransferase domain-containing protein [Dehalococcoidia bacterium]|nr:methyltransferase domain-containing protein [Dehalococcoidia bacterium]